MLEQLGPYRIERRIGQGGMGTVYEAVHLETGSRAAVKVLSTIQGMNSALRSRFDAEIETLKKLRHPHIVQLFGYGEQEGHLFYAMELVVGSSLHEQISKGRRFNAAETIRIGIQVAAALKHAHDSGVIHRDLKPANLLVAANNEIKLADFGIAKLFGGTQLTADGGIIGTADYMAPEQADGKPITSRCDLFSLGCVMYTLLAGRPPFAGKSLPQVLHALRFDSHVPVRRLAPDVPDELATLIDDLLEKDPQKRVPTALVLGNRLRSLEHGLAQRTSDQAALHADDEYRLAHDESPSSRTHGDDRPTREFSRDLGPAAPKSVSQPTVIRTSAKGAKSEHVVSPQDLTIPDSVVPAMPSHFTTLAADERRRSAGLGKKETSSTPTWLMALLTAVGLTVVVAILFFANRPPTADSLFQIVAAAGESGSVDSLRDVERQVDRFLELYAEDPRADRVRGWKESLEADRRAKQLARTARLPGGADNLSLVERTYAETLQLAVTQPEAAAEKLEQLIAVFGTGAGEESEGFRVSRLAEKQLERLRITIAKQRETSLAELTSRLDWAEKEADRQPEAAAAIRSGIVELYSSKPWATEVVERARRAMTESR